MQRLVKESKIKEKEYTYFYWLGQRDAIAYVLSYFKDKIRLKDLAEDYVKDYKEKHFSHSWHVEKSHEKVD